MKWNYSNIKQNANELFPVVREPTMMDEPLDKSPEAPSRHKSHFDSHRGSGKRQEYPLLTSDKKQEFFPRENGSSQGKLRSLKEQLVAIENELNYERERGKHMEREFEKRMSEIRKQHEQDEERWEYEIRKMRDSRDKEMAKLQEIITHQKRILDDEKVSIKNSKNAYLTPLMRLMASLGILTSNEMDFEENLRRIFEYIKELREKIQGSEQGSAEFKKKQIALTSELDITKMENNQLKETLKNNQVKNAENVEKIATMHNELLAKKNELASLELQLKEIKVNLGEKSSNNSNETLYFQAKIKDLNENVKNLEQKNKTLEEKYEALEKEKESSNQGGDLAMKNLKNEIRELEFDLKREKEKSQKLKDSEAENEKRFEELHNKLTTKDKDIKDLKDLIRKKEAQNLQISDELMTKNKEINELKTNMKQAEQTIETLNKTLDSLKQKLMNKEKEMMTGDLDETSEPRPDIKKLQDHNQRLQQEVNELRFKTEKENNINLANSPTQKKVTNGEIEKLLSDFSQKETEFENIKQSFINKLYSANEKLAFSEQKYNKLLEENTQLRGQIEEKSQEVGGEFEMRSTVHSTSDEVQSPDYANNILDMISPEMLSSDETIFLVLEMLRRISQSHKLAITLMKSKEFKELTKRICHHYSQSKQMMSTPASAYKSEPASSRNLR